MLMLLLIESINSPSVVSLCINVICQLTAKLNPLQPPVNTFDQPVCALAKKLKCMLPERFNDYIIMLKPLHIKMALHATIGDWVESIGWITVFERVQINMVGPIESSLSG